MLKEAGWANWRIARHMGRSDAAIRRCCRITLAFIRGPPTAQWYMNDILRTVLLLFFFQYPGLIFQQDNAKLETACADINCLTAYQTLPWPARSPDLSPIENVWDITGR
ncbi:transposable element Tc1 transposase [Trichonephila clavipes]|nr:transposable element Tc1 transposase [Trichonephila clavipes]